MLRGVYIIAALKDIAMLLVKKVSSCIVLLQIFPLFRFMLEYLNEITLWNYSLLIMTSLCGIVIGYITVLTSVDYKAT